MLIIVFIFNYCLASTVVSTVTSQQEASGFKSTALGPVESICSLCLHNFLPQSVFVGSRANSKFSLSMNVRLNGCLSLPVIDHGILSPHGSWNATIGSNPPL